MTKLFGFRFVSLAGGGRPDRLPSLVAFVLELSIPYGSRLCSFISRRSGNRLGSRGCLRGVFINGCCPGSRDGAVGSNEVGSVCDEERLALRLLRDETALRMEDNEVAL